MLCGTYLSTMASTSRAESTRYSSPEYFTSVPPYLLYSTTSPTLTSRGTRLAPESSKRPGPTARTSLSWGFSLAVSGITRPDAVVCSASTDLTRMRSSSGLMETDTVGLPPTIRLFGGDRGPVVAGPGPVSLGWDAGTLGVRVPTSNTLGNR